MKEQLNEVARFKQLAGILKEDLQSGFWDSIKSGRAFVLGQHIIDIEEDGTRAYVRLAKDPAKPGQKTSDILTGTLVYNKSSKQWDLSDKGTATVTTDEDKEMLKRIAGAIEHHRTS